MSTADMIQMASAGTPSSQRSEERTSPPQVVADEQRPTMVRIHQDGTGARVVTARYPGLKPHDKVYELDGFVIKVRVREVRPTGAREADKLHFLASAVLCEPATAKALPLEDGRPHLIEVHQLVVHSESDAPEQLRELIESCRHQALHRVWVSAHHHSQADDLGEELWEPAGVAA